MDRTVGKTRKRLNRQRKDTIAAAETLEDSGQTSLSRREEFEEKVGESEEEEERAPTTLSNKTSRYYAGATLFSTDCAGKAYGCVETLVI